MLMQQITTNLFVNPKSQRKDILFFHSCRVFRKLDGRVWSFPCFSRLKILRNSLIAQKTEDQNKFTKTWESILDFRQRSSKKSSKSFQCMSYRGLSTVNILLLAHPFLAQILHTRINSACTSRDVREVFLITYLILP